MTRGFTQRPQNFLSNDKNKSTEWASQAQRQLKRAFDDLRIRPKLMVLHNLFFALLGFALFLGVLPPLERELRRSWEREGNEVRQLFAQGRFSNPAEAGRSAYSYLEGTADALKLPLPGRAFFDRYPDAVFEDPENPGILFRKLYDERYSRLILPEVSAQDTILRTRVTFFAILAVIYLAAIAILELIIMPTYVYRPLTSMLQADHASIQGDREHEIIPDDELLDDEIGQIMRSRNSTVLELRRQEDRLAAALAQLEDVNADLQRKNQLLEQAKQDLEEQDRLVSLGLLSASVAHELNTPLAVLHGSIEKLQETARDDSTRQRVNRMLRVTQRLRKISESLLDFARVRRTQFEPVSVHHLILESWSLVSIDEKSSEVTFLNLIDPAHVIYGNQDRLIQVFVNLLRNALQAVAPGGWIRAISESDATSNPPVIRICVEDNGPGIPPEVLPNLFEAFVSTRLDSRGTGLGLTVAEGIVEQHGGTIRAMNCRDGGARIEVTLPSLAVVPAEVLA